MCPPGQEIAVLQGHTDRVTSVSYSPNGQTLASGSLDRTVRLWDVSTRQELAILQGHADGITSVSFSLDGQTLASSSWDKTILLWDMSQYITPPTAIDAALLSLPTQTALLANYPNPFNSRTQLAYRLAAPGLVRLELYNALGATRAHAGGSVPSRRCVIWFPGTPATVRGRRWPRACM